MALETPPRGCSTHLVHCRVMYNWFGECLWTGMVGMQDMGMAGWQGVYTFLVALQIRVIAFWAKRDHFLDSGSFGLISAALCSPVIKVSISWLGAGRALHIGAGHTGLQGSQFWASAPKVWSPTKSPVQGEAKCTLGHLIT